MSEQPQSQPNRVRADRQTPRSTLTPLNVALRLTSVAVLSAPSDPGPTIRNPAPRTISSSRASCSADPALSSSGPGGSTSSAFASLAAASAAYPSRSSPRRGDDHQLRSDRQLVETARSAHRADHPAISMNRGRHTLISASDDVPEHRLAEISRTRRGADDRDRRRRQNRPQRGHRADVVALADPLAHRLCRRDIERHGDLAQ